MSIHQFGFITTLISALLCSSVNAAERSRTLSDFFNDSQQIEGQFALAIQELLNSSDIGGPFYSYQGGVISELSPSDVALRALANNLGIQNSRAEAELATQILMEAEAVFDPSLNVSVGLERDEDFERVITGSVVETVFNPQYEDPNTGLPAGPGEIVLPEAVQQETGIETIRFTNLQADNETVDDKDIFVSKDSPNGAIDSLSMTAVLEQQTPWGARYSISLGTVNKESFYDNEGHSFDAPWASELLMNLEVPLGDFGENSSVALNRRLSGIESERQQWVVKENINSLLRQASQAYLSLIENSQLLLIRQAIKDQTQAQYDATKKRYDQRTATAYELAQIEAELNLRRSEVNTATSNYLVASNAVLGLTSDNAQKLQGRVLVPSGYSAWLESLYELDENSALQLAKENRALLQDEALRVAQADANYQSAVMRARPDVVLSAGLDMQQNGSVVGYESLPDSLGSVFDSDITTQRLGVTYNYPLRNAARKSQRTVAATQVEDAKLAQALSERTVEQEVREALNQLATAKRLKAQVMERLDASSRAWDSLQRLSQSGAANQNEVVNGLRSLQEAQIATLRANVDIKRAELAVIAANGSLAEVYANWTARNEFEIQRIAWLDKQAGLQFFGRADR